MMDFDTWQKDPSSEVHATMTDCNRVLLVDALTRQTVAACSSPAAIERVCRERGWLLVAGGPKLTVSLAAMIGRAMREWGG